MIHYESKAIAFMQSHTVVSCSFRVCNKSQWRHCLNLVLRIVGTLRSSLVLSSDAKIRCSVHCEERVLFNS
ncbi:uncharacterized protein ARMOST_15308 [Armillaria ostoyae]|uniref:Uncharacterized protein n=1 Tax=Armillaria ostoyae TaxID=47428 RepID=A0A284RSZ9_ARMOS|nr:uncharacterized protein ARMOST_15308 [Armillaria ostoyae]